jgi:hypothetical protein
MKGASRLFPFMLGAMLAVTALPAFAGSPKGACHAGGVNARVLGDTQRQYFEWYLGASDAQEVGRLFFVALPAGNPVGEDPVIWTGEEQFSVSVGRTLVLPMSTWIGESYSPDLNIPDDDVNFPEKAWFTGSDVLLTVDGRAIVDSSRSKLDCVYFDAVWFTDAIVYSQPSDYGSVAGLWVKGLGILLPPLPTGKHSIRLQVVMPPLEGVGHVGYDNQWRVTVLPPKKAR